MNKLRFVFHFKRHSLCQVGELSEVVHIGFIFGFLLFLLELFIAWFLSYV